MALTRILRGASSSANPFVSVSMAPFVEAYSRAPATEDEFFDLESFTSRGDFLAKAFTYQLYFNLVRPNTHKQNLSPWQIVEQLQPRWPLQLCLLPPVFLDYYLNDSGGYDVPRLP